MPDLVSLIIPVYNEESALPIFLDRIRLIIEKEPYPFELVFVNDGSQDRSMEILLEAREKDTRIKIIDFSRNFGKELALAAGFQAASGAAVIPMDVDLQDPPELITTFLQKWKEGFDVVLGVRQSRNSDTVVKRKSAGLFYTLFNYLCGRHLVPNAGDYRLMNRAAVDALNSLPERVRFTKGLYAWIGFKQTCVFYDRPARIAGSSKWNIWKLWNFALDGITSFSSLPLRIWTYLGGIIALCGFVYAALIVGRTLIYGIDVPGYASQMVTLLVLGGLILLSLGIIGEYLGRVYEECKRRPQYIVKNFIGFNPPSKPRCPHCGEPL